MENELIENSEINLENTFKLDFEGQVIKTSKKFE